MHSDYDTYVQAFINLCHANGVIPVILTSIPSINIANVTDDNARLAINAQARLLASDTVLIGDMDAVMTDNASPARILAGLDTGDGVHPSSAGSAVMFPVLRNAIQSYFNTH